MQLQKIVSAIVLCLATMHSALAQDTIVLKTCKKIKAKNIRIDLLEIKYTPFESPVADIDSVAKENVCMIKYQDGRNDFFTNDTLACKKCLFIFDSKDDHRSNSENTIEKVNNLFNKSEVFIKKKKENVNDVISKQDSIHRSNLDLTNSEIYLKGKTDAHTDFKCGKAFWIPFTITALPLMALPGLTATCIIACKHPNESFVKKSVANKEMLNNSLYMEGFAKGAKKKKINKAIWGFSLGLITETIGLIIMENNGLLPKSSGSGGGGHHHHH